MRNEERRGRVGLEVGTPCQNSLREPMTGVNSFLEHGYSRRFSEAAHRPAAVLEASALRMSCGTELGGRRVLGDEPAVGRAAGF